MSTPRPAPPCECASCTEMRDALAALEPLPHALLHDDDRPVLVKVGETEMTAAEAWCRLILADPKASKWIVQYAREALRKLAGRTTPSAKDVDEVRLKIVERLAAERAIA